MHNYNGCQYNLRGKKGVPSTSWSWILRNGIGFFVVGHTYFAHRSPTIVSKRLLNTILYWKHYLWKGVAALQPLLSTNTQTRCQEVTDPSLKELAIHCSLLESIVLEDCTKITGALTQNNSFDMHQPHSHHTNTHTHTHTVYVCRCVERCGIRSEREGAQEKRKEGE